MNRKDTRRGVLALLATTFAGCNEILEDADTNDNSRSTSTATPEPDAPSLEVLENQEFGIEWTPEFAEYSPEDIPEEHQVSIGVQTGDYSIDYVNLVLEKEVDLKHRKNERFSKELQLTQDTDSILAPELFVGRQQIQLEYQGEEDQPLRTEPVELNKKIPEGHIVDVRNTEGQPIGNWETPYSFDQLIYQPKKLAEKRTTYQREEWLIEDFLQRVKNDDDFDGKYMYPNRGDGRYDRGYFDFESWMNETEFHDILQWLNPAVRTQVHDSDLGGAMSGHSEEMAASIELAIDQIHDHGKARGWGFNNAGGHGTMMFYDEENEEYWHSDTTAISRHDYVRKPENAQLHRSEIWSPFTAKDHPRQPGFREGLMPELKEHDAFRDEITDEELYRATNDFARGALTSMFFGGESNGSKLFITENLMDEAYEIIRNDEPIDPILESIKQMRNTQADRGGRISKGDRVGLYGPSLEESRIVAGDEETLIDLHIDVMHDPDVEVDEQYVENYLADLDTRQ